MSSGMQTYRRRESAAEREIDRAVAAVKAERRAEWDANKAAKRASEAARQRFSREDIEGAGFIHDGSSWRKVVRVNAKTVSVVNAQMPNWPPDRISFARVYGVQQPLEGTGQQ